MLQNLFKNMGEVTKNLLIINVLFFIATVYFESRNISLFHLLGLHYPSSFYFEPYQIVTHFFIHGGFQHLLFNMLGLVFLGSNLERAWGAKRFLIFYLVTAIGAAIFSTLIDGIQFYYMYDTFFPPVMDGGSAGASGAIFGLIAAYGLLFPNIEFRLYFLIPVKAKWVAIASAVIAIYGGIFPVVDSDGVTTGHFAHLGGMIFGFILIKIWQKGRNQFY